MNAYDYKNQRWLEGQEGTDLLREQLNQELDILESSRGQEYAGFINLINKETTIANIKLTLLELIGGTEERTARNP